MNAVTNNHKLRKGILMSEHNGVHAITSIYIYIPLDLIYCPIVPDTTFNSKNLCYLLTEFSIPAEAINLSNAIEIFGTIGCESNLYLYLEFNCNIYIYIL